MRDNDRTALVLPKVKVTTVCIISKRPSSLNKAWVPLLSHEDDLLIGSVA